MKILNKLTIKHLKENKKRTIVTIIGIILSTALMCGIGLLFSTIRQNSIDMIISENGLYHSKVNVDSNKMDLISKNDDIKNYMYKSSLGYAYVDSKNDYKPYVNLYSASDNYLNSLILLEGNYPENENEVVISEHLIKNGNVNYKIGDKIKLDFGTRISDGVVLTDENSYQVIITDDDKEVLEELTNLKTYEFKIVGIVKRDVLEPYQSPGYSIFTKNIPSSAYTTYITYKKIKDTYKNTDKIVANLGITGEYSKYENNNELLSMYGVSNYGNVISSLNQVIIIILSLVMIACVIVIYNSFAISVMERKKQFGLNASIGATKKQIRYTVFFEAMIVGIIGIPLGILSSYIGIGVLLKLVNYLLPNIFSAPLKLVTYPTFILIPIIFIIITIFLSSLLPAYFASKISPIEAIRQNDDIKIKSKKIKSPKIIRKIFKVEGDLAYKNIKRNKKKYRVTIISLFISIVLFISFSALIKYGIEGSINFTELPSYDYLVDISAPTKLDVVTNKVNEIISNDKVEDYTLFSNKYFELSNIDGVINEKYKNSDDYIKDPSIILMGLDRKNYDKYKNKLKVDSDKTFVINKSSFIKYTNNSRKQISYKMFESISKIDIKLEDDKNYTFDNIYLTLDLPYGVDYSSNDTIILIVPIDTYGDLFGDSYYRTICLSGSKLDEVKKIVADLDKENKVHANIYDVGEELKLMTNIVLVIKILLYGFISLVTLIGVTSVLNTINTSIKLRRKEFAVLRSIGLTPHGFNKILFFESLFFGLTSLIYALPISILIVYLFHIAMSDVVTFSTLLIPYKSIFISIIGVFIIVIISNYYASIKIKKENILDAIREENI